MLDVEDLAELWDVDEDDVATLLEAAGYDPEGDFDLDMFEDWSTEDLLDMVPIDDETGRPELDYMTELADQTDWDVSDLYDMFYGYTPGES